MKLLRCRTAAAILPLVFLAVARKGTPAGAAPPPAPTLPRAGSRPTLPHGFFSGLVRVFARVESVDPVARTLAFVEDATGEIRTQPLKPDTDVFVNELPGEVTSLTAQHRIWVAMEGSAARKQYGSIRFVADEPTYQALHGTWYTVQSVDPAARKAALVTGVGVEEQKIELPASADFQLISGSQQKLFADLQPGMVIRFQSRYRSGRYEMMRAVSQLGWALNKARQAAELDAGLAARGLPAQIYAAEGSGWQVLVHRAGSDWARRLKGGDRITLEFTEVSAAPALPAVVESVRPWGEKTLVGLRAGSGKPPTREGLLRLHMPQPQRGPLPGGLGIAKDPAERIEWFLSTIYCTCPVAGDRCTGHLYTLSMCDQKNCGKPGAMKNVLSRLIQQGLSDAEILRRLQETEGPALLVPHLLK